MSAAVAFSSSAEAAGKISVSGGIRFLRCLISQIGIIHHQSKHMFSRRGPVRKVKHMRCRQRLPAPHKSIVHPEHRVPQAPFQKKRYMFSQKRVRDPYFFLIPGLSHIGISPVQIPVILLFRPGSLSVAVRCPRQIHLIGQLFQIPFFRDSPALRIQGKIPASI